MTLLNENEKNDKFIGFLYVQIAIETEQNAKETKCFYIKLLFFNVFNRCCKGKCVELSK